MNIISISGIVMGDPKITEDRAVFSLFYVDKNLKFNVTCVAQEENIFNHVKRMIKDKNKLFITGKMAVKGNKIYILLLSAEHGSK